ncbi:MAG TPA: hypothetical protein VFG79_01935 [Solirubrobacter sp.]|nr:hypothetical protein [Solirubrobacter sp.]
MKTVLIALAALLLTAPAAHAAVTVTTSTTQAGAPADVTIDATFAQPPDSVNLHLPPGLVGNPNAAPRCPLASFRGPGCPLASQVGTASANGLPLGQVFNLEPEPGEPARLGIVLGLLIKNEASVTLRPDGGLDSTIAQLDRGGLPLTSLGITLDSAFMTLPTSCLPATVTLNGESDTFTPTGCENVPFAPAVAARLETTQRVVPSGATVTLELPEGDSHVRRAEIALPVGTTLSPGVAAGLIACTQAQFEGGGCPDGAQVGTVSFVTPLLGTLGGRVYFGDGFRLYVVVEGHGVLVKLAGDVRLDPATGQITTVFDNLPQVPFTSFALTFNGGPHAVLANPVSCGTKELRATLTPWSGTAPRTAAASFTIDADGHGGSCAAAAFAPSLAVGATSTAAGRPAGTVTLAVSRSDADQNLTRVTTNLPPGLAGSLKGVPVCPDAAADAGACPAATRIGSVSALAGSGAAPVPLAGSVSLTGPTDGGLAGMAIALPARVGPVDLGTVVVRAGILLRPDGGLTVRTRPLPQIVGGVPVAIRQLALTLDRPGFILNSSSCAPQQVTALLEGAGGASATVSAPYQATDCAGLAFAPKLKATVGKRGKTRRGKAAPLHAVITVPAGHSSTAAAEVALPRAIGVNLKKLSKACAPAMFAAGACPKSARIGSAKATTPLLDAPLASPVTLAVPAPGQLPGLALQLTGPVTLPLFGKVDVFSPDGLVHNTFAGIPDVPLGRFDLKFKGSPLSLTRNVCRGKRQYLRARLTGHNGRVVNLRARLRVRGCPPRIRLTRHRLRVRHGRDGARIKRVKLGKHRVKRSQRVHLRAGKRYRVTVKDRKGRTWKRTVRVRR